MFKRIARLGTGSWGRLSSTGRRWYGLSRSQPFTDKESLPRSTPENRSQEYDRPVDVEVGQFDHL